MKKLLMAVLTVFVVLLGTLRAEASTGAGDDTGGGGYWPVCLVFASASAPVAVNGTAHWAGGVAPRGTAYNWSYSSVDFSNVQSEWACSQQMVNTATFGSWGSGIGGLIFPEGGYVEFAAYYDGYLVDTYATSLGGGSSGGGGIGF